jgi:hypothetical protein
MDGSINAYYRYRSQIFAIISFACPVIAFLAIDIYQDYAYSDFWQSLTPADDASNNAGALMGFVVVVQIVFSIIAGSAVGIVFAAISIWTRRKLASLGTAALIFNSIPLLFFLVIFFSRLSN